MGRDTSTWKSDKWCIVLKRLIQQEKGPVINRSRKMAERKNRSFGVNMMHLIYRTKEAKLDCHIYNTSYFFKVYNLQPWLRILISITQAKPMNIFLTDLRRKEKFLLFWCSLPEKGTKGTYFYLTSIPKTKILTVFHMRNISSYIYHHSI